MKELDWVSPGERFDLCTASPLQIRLRLLQMKGERAILKTSVFGQRLQLHVRKVILTTGLCYICTLSLLHPVLVPLCQSIKRNKKKKKTQLILLLTEALSDSRSPLPELLWKQRFIVWQR